MSELVIVTPVDGILRVQLNRPEKRNALTIPMYRAIADALERAQADDDVRVVYITGTPGCFTAGNDLMGFMNPADAMVEVPRLFNNLAIAEKPLVAGVSGVAIGVGVTMLLHCDLVYAASGATFRTPFVDLGICPEAASSLLMPLMMGQRRAAELLLLGETISAEQARDYGLVNAVFENDDLEARAMAKARQLADRAPAALLATKRLMKRAQAEAVQEAMAAEGAILLERLRSPELAEAVTAFMQRREPDFSKLR